MTRRGHAKRGEFRDRCLLPDLRIGGDIWPTDRHRDRFTLGKLEFVQTGFIQRTEANGSYQATDARMALACERLSLLQGQRRVNQADPHETQPQSGPSIDSA